ncbi:MAG: glycosyltransferase [Clostridium sp.]|uniref:MGDG synthase family glycosyltransferase n=1 Tax=Clostridium sp. TaxID=1506 RepID=UPI00290E50C6|nr:glycosyltransferase [Clostridium sp.]MDU7336534.1 glycosyltransferase [Clostridium sp.]
MKILILSAATGGGHLRASHAIESYLLENATDVEVKVVDALKTIHPILDKTICEGYHFLATKTPKMFGLLYQKSNEENPLAQMVPKFNSLFGIRLIPLLEEYQPDVIIATHPFVTEMVSHLKEKGHVKVPLICVMTDYGPHKAWISDKVDAYIVSNEDMVPDMEAMGVRREIVYPFGIPVYDVFFDKADKAALLEELGMQRDELTILIMAGSFGVSNILQIYEDIVCLDFPFQIIVITGRNEKLFQAFEDKIEECRLSPQMGCKHTRLVFFTNEVEKYMHASDLIITKPGGLTVSEALACNVPLAVFDAIPGQEEDNANFLMSHDMAVRIRKGDDCAGTISELLQNREKLEKMRQSCQSFDKSQSSKNILSLIYELVGREEANRGI